MTLSEVNELNYPLLRAGDVEGVERMLIAHHELLATPDMLNYNLRLAANYNHVGVMAKLVEWGADVNAPHHELDPAGPLHSAADDGAADAVRWLLANGATVEVPGQTGRHRCPGLSAASLVGSLECVRILVEAGAPLDACGEHALRCANYGGHTSVADYLRSVGVPDDEPEEPVVDESDDAVIGGPIPELRQHLENRLLGTLEPNSFQNILPSDPPIAVLVLDQFGVRKALVTEGLSAVRLTGDDRFARAELILRLPADWPLDATTLRDDRHAWPITWLRRMAHLPLEHDTNFKLYTLYDHEEPLGPGVRFTGFLVIVTPGDHGSYTRADGQRVQLYDLLPLYPEELAFAGREGVRALLERLDGRDDVAVVTPDRPSLVP